MKNIFLLIVLIAGFAILIGCDKYKDVKSEIRVSGYVKLHDTLGLQFPVPLPGKSIYLNQGTDSASYILQTTSDAAGYFSFNYIDNGASIVYLRYTDSGTEFFGLKKITQANKDSLLQVNVYPTFYNGVSIRFNDSYQKPISNLAFRLYTSRIYAVADSTKHAYYSGATTSIGLYTQYNVPANTYYIVASDKVGGVTIKALDSLTVTAKGIFRRITTVK